ncbi:MAG: prolyl oligopeptidase family serine peptidase [Vicinamibacterales bacterium]
MRPAPCGTWSSPVSAAVVASGSLRLSEVQLDGDETYWLEGRPLEGGRSVLVRRSPDGAIADVTPPGSNVRTAVHEYGGGSYVVHAGAVCYSEFADGRLYRLVAGGSPEPLTPARAWRHADLAVDPERQRLVCVREDHTAPGDAVTTLVGIALDGSGRESVLASGYDFYAAPRVSPDGRRLCWLAWRHPQMPWDGTELWVAEFDASGQPVAPLLVAGGPSESVYQPGWDPTGTLLFVSDRSGWWRPCRWRDGLVETVPGTDVPGVEFGRPQWQFGTATWACAGPASLVLAHTQDGLWRLGALEAGAPALRDLAPDLQPSEWLAADARRVVCVASSPRALPAVVEVSLGTGHVSVLRQGNASPLDPEAVSVAVPIEFPTDGGRTAHAFHYPPRSATCAVPEGERPPLIVIGHGGPTAAASAGLSLAVQFWTSRGFAVADVNYSGSSGYGRAYRERLRGAWGVADVADLVAVARHLVAEGLVDPARLIIRGGSAGGYTALAALTFRPGTFQAAASYFGVSDLEALAQDTHKFESRYLDGLVGPWPAAQETYRARSPIHAVDRLSCALIVFQGQDDRVVPPSQSARMVEAVRARGFPVAYLLFEGEQHGFRRAETIQQCLESELGFYGAVFGFLPAGDLAPVPIDNRPGAENGDS